MNKRILLVEDDDEISSLLCTVLKREGFEPVPAYDGLEGEYKANNESFDAIVLDIMLPGKNGLEILKSLRVNVHTPIIMLTAKGEDLDRIIGLELGADDYLPKPFNPRELIARINALLRRVEMDANPSDGDQQAIIELNGFTIYRQKLEVLQAGHLVDLTQSEFRILDLLARKCDTVVSKSELTEYALGRRLTLYDRAIDMHVSNLRRKLYDSGITTVRGVGYLLKTRDMETRE